MFSCLRSYFAFIKEPQNLEWDNHWYQWRLGMDPLPRLGIPVAETLDVSWPCVVSAWKINRVWVQGSDFPLLCPGGAASSSGTNGRRMGSCWWESRGGHRDGLKAGPLCCGDRLGGLGAFSQDRRRLHGRLITAS